MDSQAIHVRLDDGLGRILQIWIAVHGKTAHLSTPTLDKVSRTAARAATLDFATKETATLGDDLFELEYNGEAQGMLLDRDELLAMLPRVLSGEM